ncbi:MAG: hypothetical protein M0Q93_01995, partial [Terrimicrobiaceae bacterium]|nr:hypothetical protein [Terrimicrobiaceae bacterium]
MEAMRHSDPKLTLGVYTDSEMLPVRDAIECFPSFGSDAQRDAQKIVASRLEASQPASKSENADRLEMLINRRYHIRDTVLDSWPRACHLPV